MLGKLPIYASNYLTPVTRSVVVWSNRTPQPTRNEKSGFVRLV